ncbi:hypothetical protein RLEG3_02955 (plasmid) [Rhizobium leguminosarum bv. trifolii WSM1689]|nr:hypothetical protein RLEG3_02955 [Rhizobium leguminosarum bv. trifolii WSM1689]
MREIERGATVDDDGERRLVLHRLITIVHPEGGCINVLTSGFARHQMGRP